MSIAGNRGARTIEARPLGKCPECGAGVAATIDGNGMPDGIIHEMPTCHAFDSREAQEFATWMRKRLYGSFLGEA